MHEHDEPLDPKLNCPEHLDQCEHCIKGNTIVKQCVECGVGLCEYCAIKCSGCSTNGAEITTCEDCVIPHRTKGVHMTPTLTINNEEFSFVVKAEDFMFQEFKTP